jgi:hypothetical protein
LESYVLQIVMVMNVIYQVCSDNVMLIVLGVLMIKLWRANWKLSFEITGGVRGDEPRSPNDIDDDDSEEIGVDVSDQRPNIEENVAGTDDLEPHGDEFGTNTEETGVCANTTEIGVGTNTTEIGSGTNTREIGGGTSQERPNHGTNSDPRRTATVNNKNKNRRSRGHRNKDDPETEFDPSARSSGDLHPPVRAQLPDQGSDVRARFGSPEETGFVFAPRYGKVYHKPNCGTLKAARSVSRCTLSIHMRLKLKPCGQCTPRTL